MPKTRVLLALLVVIALTTMVQVPGANAQTECKCNDTCTCDDCTSEGAGPEDVCSVPENGCTSNWGQTCDESV